jgi:hypothetical protein
VIVAYYRFPEAFVRLGYNLKSNNLISFQVLANTADFDLDIDAPDDMSIPAVRSSLRLGLTHFAEIADSSDAVMFVDDTDSYWEWIDSRNHVFLVGCWSEGSHYTSADGELIFKS